MPLYGPSSTTILSSGELASIFAPEDYGAVRDGVTNDKAAIQAAHDAAEAAGGILQLSAGTYAVHPLATGIGLLFNGDKVCVRGVGPETVIRFIASTSTLPFEGIAPDGYNTASTAYGASGLWVEDLKVEADGYDLSTDSDLGNCHGLIGVIHAPWARIKNVTFGNVAVHQFEIGWAKNVLVENCNFVGQVERCRIQLDTGDAGQESQTTGAISHYTNSHITFRGCRMASVLLVDTSPADPMIIDLCHSANQRTSHVTIEDCEIGTYYKTDGTFAGYGIYIGTAGVSMDHLTIRNNRFLGMKMGNSGAITLLPGAMKLTNVEIDGNEFTGGTDANGVWHPGGFYRCIVVGQGTSRATIISAGAGTITNYNLRHGIKVTNNTLRPKFLIAPGQSITGTLTDEFISASALQSAIISGNTVIGPVHTATATFTDTLSLITSGIAHELSVGDMISFNTTGALPTGFDDITGGSIEADDEVFTKVAHGLVTGDPVCLTSFSGGTGLSAGTGWYFHKLTDDTGYLCSSTALATAGTPGTACTVDATSVVLSPIRYVVEAPTATTFRVSATAGGAAITAASAGSGTHEWTHRVIGGAIFGQQSMMLLADIANLHCVNNSFLWQHGDNMSSGLCGTLESNWYGMESAGVTGYVHVANNRVSEIGAGTANTAFTEWGTDPGTATILGWFYNNTAVGTYSNGFNMVGHPEWYGTLNAPSIGAITPGTGAFTTLSASGATTLTANTASTTTTTGTLVVTGGIGVSGNVISGGKFDATANNGGLTLRGTTPKIGWNGYFGMHSLTDGVMRFFNDASTAGVALDVGTDGTLKVRDKTNGSDGTLTAGAGTFSGKLSSTATAPAALGVGATTLAITSNVVTVTGDAGGNTLATITGGVSGMVLILIFADGLVTITDDASGNANTVNLSAAWTGSADDTLTLVHNGTSWRETARSVN